jgi:hypothetical protein
MLKEEGMLVVHLVHQHSESPLTCAFKDALERRTTPF